MADRDGAGSHMPKGGGRLNNPPLAERDDENKRLLEQLDALRGYARHANDCSWWEPPYFGRGIEGSACSCGLHEVLGVSNPATSSLAKGEPRRLSSPGSDLGRSEPGAATSPASSPASSPPDLERRFRLADYGQPPVEPDPAMCRHARTTERPRYAVDDEPGHYLCLDCGDKFPLIGDTDMWEPKALDQASGSRTTSANVEITTPAEQTTAAVVNPASERKEH